MDRVIREIQAKLSNDMLQDPYRTRVEILGAHPFTGHSRVACEALWHLTDVRERGYKPRALKVGEDSHWFLQHPDGTIYDPTVVVLDPCTDYSKSKGMWFRAKPSKWCRVLLKRIHDERGRRASSATGRGAGHSPGQDPGPAGRDPGEAPHSAG